MTKFYKITLAGAGGEVVSSAITPEEYTYWVDEADQRRAEFNIDEGYDPFYEYMTDADSSPERWKAVPEQFVREYWHENDDLLHIFGPELTQAIITVDEIDDEDVIDADIIENLIDEEPLQTLIEDYEIKQDIKTVEDWCSHSGPTLFGLSQEKGEFYQGLVVVEDGEIDLSLLSFTTYELTNGDSIISSVFYDGNEIYNDGGDTRGIALYIEIHD